MKNKTVLPLLTFLAIAFVLPLFCALFSNMPFVYRSEAAALVLFAVEGASPAIAAILTVALRQRGGLRAFLRQCYICHFNIRQVFAAFLLPVLLIVFAKSVYSIASGLPFALRALAPVEWMGLLWALVAEELGWRGFLQPKLDQFLHPLLSPLVVGGLWTLWHYHYYIFYGLDVPVLLFTLGCISQSYLYAFLTRRAHGNIVPASVFHFSGNLCINVFMLYPADNGGNILPCALFIAATAVVAAVMGLRMRAIKKTATT